LLPDARQVLVLVPLLVLTPAIVGGVIRMSTGLALGPALALGGLVAALGAWGGARRIRCTGRTGWALAGAAITATVAVYALEVRAFEGLPSVGGGDAGNHIGNARWFDGHSPRAYFQFVVFYGLVGLIRRMTGSNPLQAFRIGWDLLLATIAWVAFAVAWIGGRARRPPVRATVAILTALAVAGTTWLALLGYDQADGFYSHLAGLTVVSLALVCAALPPSRGWRLAALAATPVVLRFTYGLNLADLLASVALLVWFEGEGVAAPRLRRALRVAVVCCLVAAAAAGHALWGLRALEGAIVRPERRAFLGALACLVAALAWSLQGCGAGVKTRLLRAGLVFTGTTAAVQWGLAALGLPDTYYPVKHGFQAMLIGTLAAGAIVAGAGRRTAGALALAMAGLVLARMSVRPYWGQYTERLRGTPPWRGLQPLFDPDALARIPTVLGAERNSFGGYLDPSWPLANAMNAALEFPGDWTIWDVGQRQFDGGSAILGAGTCVFWSDALGDELAYQRLTGGFGQGTARSWARLRALPDVRCTDYRAPWDGRVQRRLCWHCGEPPG
jgi:hypothetical protein